MRATAFMQRAYSHGRALEDLVQKVMVDMPTQQTLEILREVKSIRAAPPYRVTFPPCDTRQHSLVSTKHFFYFFPHKVLLSLCRVALNTTRCQVHIFANCFFLIFELVSGTIRSASDSNASVTGATMRTTQGHTKWRRNAHFSFLLSVFGLKSTAAHGMLCFNSGEGIIGKAKQG